MTFEKGRSGNPAGRPPKSRSLTVILEKALAKSESGKSRKKLLAELITEFAVHASVTFNGRTLKAQSVREWFEAVKWIYSHIDGPAPMNVDLTTQGEPLIIIKRPDDADS